MKFIAMTVCCMDVYKGINLECVGGNALNIATQYIKSGVENISVLGAVGKDTYGLLARNHLSYLGVDVSHLYEKEGRTASNKVYIDEKGDRYFLPDSWDGGVYETFRLSEEDWDFVGTHDVINICAHDPNFNTLLEKKKPSVKLVADFLDRRDFDAVEQLVPTTDISFISGDDEVAARLKPLSKSNGSLIVVTLGEKGSKALYNGIEYYCEAIPVREVVDTTGCGDAYQAAFTVSWLTEGNLKKAMELGSLAAAYVLTHFGGVE